MAETVNLSGAVQCRSALTASNLGTELGTDCPTRQGVDPL